ncbi:unnamed protein product [Owenia fusiformis]|uniref:TRADD-like N-terminal domain-containing protein n=1 Tax=Owenia fusiformis TaxID=6347 RepID=A0A8S4PXF2_OWEFU|nr:unnamed protein product [Owenia fusiformis]
MGQHLFHSIEVGPCSQRLLRVIGRLDIIHLLSLSKHKTVKRDPVDQYLEQMANKEDHIQQTIKDKNLKNKTPLKRGLKRKHADAPVYTHPPNSGVYGHGSPHNNAKSLNSASDHTSPTNSVSGTTSPSNCTNGHASSSNSTSSDASLSNSTSGHASSSDSTKGHSLPGSSSYGSPGTSERLDMSPPISKRLRRTKSRTERENRIKKKLELAKDSKPYCTIPKRKQTCDIRLRVRAEYCNHENALEGNIFSNKPDALDRQFEKFMQANTILKSRDLGSIICDIKFSELTYLDAFWRDYINGSLLEALKGVFLTDSLKQAVGHEAIQLLVNVDEDDYVIGRKRLLQNLQD